MGFNNTITVIGNKSDFVEQISSKLVLLRDLDKVTRTALSGAAEFLKNNIPNVILLHCYRNDPDSLALIKQIKQDEILKNIPILLLNDECSREALIEAFDSGVSDILACPAPDYELLIRVIWCIQKNEINTNIETRKDFMRELGIVLDNSGVYTQNYCEQYLKCELNNIEKYKQSACLMIVAPDTKQQNYKNPKEFLEVLNKSIRLNDSIAIKDVDEFYVLLPKTKLNGVYSVFERFNKNLGENCAANGAVIEIKDKKFEEVKELLQNALDKAKNESGSLIIASPAYLNDNGSSMNLAKLKNAVEEKKQQQLPPKKVDLSEEGPSKLYQQAYKQKCKIVYEPVFEKYQKRITSKIKDSQAQYEVNENKTKFTMLKNNARASLRISYGGAYKIKIDTTVTYCDVTKSANSVVMDFIQLNFQKLSQILEELYIEFKNYAKL